MECGVAGAVTIKRADSGQGALTDIELQSVLEKSAHVYECGRLDITGLCVIQLLASSGRRSVQLAALKIKDVVRRQDAQGFYTYHINYPRAKQRSTGFREMFREVVVIKDVWDVLQLQIKQTLSIISSCVGVELPEELRSEMPLFVYGAALAGIRGLDALAAANFSDNLHPPSKGISGTLSAAMAVCDVYSERTGNLINLTPRRFRYTLGTRAAREGWGIHVIAELLDHTDTQAAHVYTQNVPEYAARIDETVGQHLAPYAQAFAGVLVDSKINAVRGDDPTSDIRDFSGKGTGTCGHYGFCAANVPVPCYTCMHFQPWLDGPHETVYEGLVQERARIASVTQDAVITTVLDRSILAVAQVIQACNKRHAK